jgi:hypothetical protein
MAMPQLKDLDKPEWAFIAAKIIDYKWQVSHQNLSFCAA